ncbi:hypothetical protein [Streptomyces sp. IB2014 016-6]|nr:hypothetical protein [Streptomyces sp. IB2014 016-6]
MPTTDHFTKAPKPARRHQAAFAGAAVTQGAPPDFAVVGNPARPIRPL